MANNKYIIKINHICKIYIHNKYIYILVNKENN